MHVRGLFLNKYDPLTNFVVTITIHIMWSHLLRDKRELCNHSTFHSYNKTDINRKSAIYVLKDLCSYNACAIANLAHAKSKASALIKGKNRKIKEQKRK